eukprot:scaffold50_cov420-Prasinococcus_capsulatus_cf.AAC.38
MVSLDVGKTERGLIMRSESSMLSSSFSRQRLNRFATMMLRDEVYQRQAQRGADSRTVAAIAQYYLEEAEGDERRAQELYHQDVRWETSYSHLASQGLPRKVARQLAELG